MSDDPVVAALRAAISVSESPELHAALGDQLQANGLASEALAAVEAGLRRFPAAPVLLASAVKAARASGQVGRATAYELALGALAPGVPAHAMATQPAPEPQNEDEVEDALEDDGTPKVSDHQPAEVPTATSRPADPGGRLRLVTEEAPPEPPPLTFAAVAGLDDLKARLDRSFLSPLRNPELHQRFGKKVGGGLLLYGPPGCGKTFLARALAGELGARFTSVGLTDVLDMWLGASERNLHELFENARRTKPTVLFLDEVDAIGQRRSNLRGSAGRNVVNQLLTEMDGVAAANEGLFFLAATNHPWDVDPALRRPGRLDRLVFVPPPDEEAREQLLALALRDRPVSPGTSLAAVARAAAEYSGADLAAVVEQATELAIEATRRLGSDLPIDARLLERAAKEVRPSTRAWFELARHHAVYANEGGAYDDLLAYLKKLKLA